MARPQVQAETVELLTQVIDFMFQHRQLFGTILGVAAYEFIKRRRQDLRQQRRELEVLEELADLQVEIRRLRDEIRERHLAATRPVPVMAADAAGTGANPGANDGDDA